MKYKLYKDKKKGWLVYDVEVLGVNEDAGYEESVDCHGWLRRVGEDAGDAEQDEGEEVDEDCERTRASF